MTPATYPFAVFHKMQEPRPPIVRADTGARLNRPDVLLDLVERQQPSVDILFDGLKTHFLPAMCGGNINAWRRAAHAIIDLVADVGEAKITKRSELTAASSIEPRR